MVPARQSAHTAAAAGASESSRNFPATQSSQYAEPSPEVPLVHLEHAVDPEAAENSPGLHGRHAPALCAPGSALRLPGAQSLHMDADAAPKAALNFPAPHSSHSVNPSPVVYAPAPHSSQRPPSWYLPASQLVQPSEPMKSSSPYFPGGHVEQP